MERVRLSWRALSSLYARPSLLREAAVLFSFWHRDPSLLMASPLFELHPSSPRALALQGLAASLLLFCRILEPEGSGDPDAFPATDLGVIVAARQLGLPGDARSLIEHSTRWRPWRAYATQHLWTALDHEVNHWPPLTAKKAK